MNKEEIEKMTGDLYFEEWYAVVKDIIEDSEFQKRVYFPQHRHSNVFEHSVLVSYDAFTISYSWKKVDSRKCAIAGLLHDFSPYLWKKPTENNPLEESYYKEIKQKKWKEPHSTSHGFEAAENYVKFFPELKDKEISDDIRSHMFPLTRPPRYRSGWLITFCDKRAAFKDFFRFRFKRAFK